MRNANPKVLRNSKQFGDLCGALFDRGLTVRFRANGLSMRPNILNDDGVLVAPVSAANAGRGDVLLTHGAEGFRVHRLVSRSTGGEVITRADSAGECDPATKVLGKVIAIERNGRRFSLNFPGQCYVSALRSFAFRLAQAAALRTARFVSACTFFFVALFFVLTNAAPAVGQAFTITNTAVPATVAPGGTITYAQRISNTSGTAITHPIAVSQTIPTGTTFVSMNFAGHHAWSCLPANPAAGTTLTCTDTSGGSYNSGGNDNTTFTLVVTVNPTVGNGTVIPDTVTVTSGNAPTVNATANVTVQVPDISVSETAAPNPVATGANITYTETVTNNNTTSAASGVTLTQSTPPHTLFQSATPPAGWTCPTVPAVGATGNIVCTATGTLPANSSVNITLVVSVSPEAPAGSSITNSITVSESGTDPNPANNTATATVQVLGADLSMTQTASATGIAPGNTITYTETVTNNGPNAATGATLYQQTPVNTTFASMTPPAGWTCGTLPAAGATGQIICTANAAMNSGTTTGNFTYVVTVNAATGAGTVISNQADVTAQTTDGNPANNGTLTTALVELTPDSDLSVAMTALPSPVFISSSLTYTIQVSNFGLAPGTAVTLTDSLPVSGSTSLLTNVTASSTQGICTVASTSVSCNLGTVAYPLLTPITITISGTTPAAPVTLLNTATVSTTGTDPVSSNNTVTIATVVQPLVCAAPGHDGAPGTLSGVVNAYYPPSGTVTLTAGTSTSVPLGAAAANGAQTNISAGDLLLLIQMQGAQINSTNTTSYGDGIPGDPFGSTNLGSTGVFEFVTATNSVTASTGGTLNFVGTGAGGTLLNTYVSAPATTSQGIQTFQVIRVPQYSSATLSSSLTAMPWNGATGGVLSLDVASQLTLNGAVVLDGLGFRGGAGIIERGINGFTRTDTVNPSPTALPNLTGGDPPAGGGAGGGKGEGIAGTPHWVGPSVNSITHASTAASTGQAIVEGYPNGSFARGAPGNAGGGATDANPVANDQNSGGGAGGNGGQGGIGGFGWNSAGLVGGYGGAPFPATTSAIVMGGGGGGGTTNNGSYWDPITDTGNADCGLNCTGVYSTGGAGGGIVIIHAGSVVGTGTISANGQSALAPENDGAGGGGAGGTILVFTQTGGLGGLTASAAGGNGGNTWPEDAPGATFPGNRHGAGGGGGGGTIFTTAAPGNPDVSNGNPGWSTLANDPYGATPGQPGVLNSGLTITQTPGVQSGAYCSGADLAVTNSGTPNPVLAGPGPGNAITYTQTVTNNGPFPALNATFSEAIPANTTFQSINFPGGSGWLCNAPVVGGTGTISCTNPNVANAASTTFTVAVAVNTGVASGTVVTDIDNVTAGNSDPNLANNSATVQTTVALATTSDLSITNTAAPNPVIAGSNITYTVVVTNNGVAAAATVAFSEAIPANTTFVTVTPSPATGWTCGIAAGTLTCSNPTVASGASTTFTVVVTVNAGTASGSVITDTANVSSATIDPNPNNNSATATDVVATAGQSDLSITSVANPANVITDGNNISYTQTVSNNGPSASGAATFTDTIPTGTTLVSFTPPAGWNCGTLPPVGGAGTITCLLASMAANSSANFPLVVKASLGDTPGTAIANTANINIPCSSASDPNCGNNSAATTVFVASPTQADLAITKTASPDPVDQGTNLTYTLQVTNNGPAPALSVTVSDPIPGEVTYASVATTQGACTYTAGTTTVNCNLGTVTVGSLVVITINVTANTFSSTTLSTNTATVSSTTGDPNSANNTSSFTSTIATPTAVQLTIFRAVPRSGGGVLIEWKTREEVRNLGFNLYRADGARRERVNPSLIAGSALLIRGGWPQHSTKNYQWLDPNGTAQSTYELEDVDLNGTRTSHGPVSVDESLTPSAGAISQSILLKRLNSAIVQPAIASRRVLRTPTPILPGVPHNVVPVSLDGEAAVKIFVQSEGWYRVTQAQLVAAGMQPNFDARTLQLYAEGVEQPVLILGNQSGTLGPNDSIEFYGTGIDTPYSDTRVYWLIRGTHPGLRIATIAPSSAQSAEPQSFPFTVVLQQRTTYFATLLNGEDNDNFFGAAVTSQPVDQQLTVAHADPNSPMQISVDITLQGATDQQAHSVSVAFNGASIGEIDFANLTNVTNTFPVDRSLLQDGVNTVTLTALNGDNDISVVQSIALHYPHTYEADANWLKATAAAGSTLHVTGFTNPRVQAFDITNPLAVEQLSGPVDQGSASYGITLNLAATGTRERTLLIFTGDQIAPPSGLAFHAPAALARKSYGSKMIMITYPDVESALTPLVSLHESRGVSVKLVTIDEIFDAFNYGERSPYAIREFLQSTQSNWMQKPKYLLLVGGASLDPRDYLGLGAFDLVPTRMIETAAFKTASDDWFSDFNQTGFATIATGRLPVRTLADAELTVSKIVSFEKGLGDNSANAQALLIADQNIGADFSTATKFAATDLPSSLQPVEIFADGQDPATVSQQIQSALDAGPLLVNYSGHGSEEQWSFSDLLDDTSAAALSNNNQYSVYFLMDCLNGFFQDVYGTSLAQSLLLAPNGGAAAVWASSGFTIEPPQASMNQALLQTLKDNPGISIGSAILQAKSIVTDNDVRRTWIFFGDPAMSLQLAPAEGRRPVRVHSPTVLQP